ncbi:MAG: tetratricopeptide repeat protein [Verrucomicrobiae bacterium]|nr:tetratricopeptide repeat protein [Verrucomicrobiae bacterium]
MPVPFQTRSRHHSWTGFCLGVVLLGFLTVLPDVHGQKVRRADEICNDAEKAITEGRFGDAIVDLDDLLTRYKASPELPRARYMLSFSYVMTGEFNAAINRLVEMLADKNLDPVLREQGLFLLAQAYTSQTSKLEKEEEKQAFFKKAEETYSKFLTDFPKSQFREDTLNGRGLVYFFLDQPENSIRDLELSLKDYPKSESVLDTKFLLGLVNASLAVEMAQAKKPEETAKRFAVANKLFVEIVEDGRDIPLANDARYRMAEILLNDEKFKEALPYYRKILPKTTVLEKQQEKVNRIQEEMKEAVRQKNQERVRALQRYYQKERGKLREIEEKTDLYIEAAIRRSGIYNNLNRQDEARILLRQYAPFLKPEQQKSARNQTVISFAAQGLLPQAESEAEKFEKDYPNSVEADQFAMLIGNAYLTQGKKDQALETLKKGLEKYPKGRSAPEILVLMATILKDQGKLDEAVKIFEDFLSKKGDSEMAQGIMLNLAQALYSMKEYDRAVKALNDFRSKYPNSANFFDTFTLQAKMQMDQAKYDDAIKSLREMLANKPAPPDKSGALALYMIAQCHEKAKKDEDALKAYQECVDKYPKETIAEECAKRIALTHQRRKDPARMVEAFEMLIAKFPQSELVADAHVAIGQSYEQQKPPQYDKALERYRKMQEAFKGKPQEALAIQRMANLPVIQARSMAKYASLMPDEQKKWNAFIDEGLKTYEQIIEKMPTHEKATDALAALFDIHKLRVDAGLIKPGEIAGYFETLAGKNGSNAQLKTNIETTQAAVLLYAGQPTQSLELFRKALASNPGVRLSSDNQFQYGLALLENGMTAEALQAFQKQYSENQKNQVESAKGFYGMGQAFLKLQKWEDAETAFGALIRMPWSPYVQDGQAALGLGIAQLELKKYDEAVKTLTSALQIRNSSNRTKAVTMLRLGDAFAAQGKKRVPPQGPDALGYYVKVEAFYGFEKDVAAEAIYKAVVIYRELGNTKEADEYVARMKKNYADTEWAKKL